MSAINLLPWREWRRERARKTLFVNFGLSVTAAMVVVAALGWQLDRETSLMDQRADYLRQRIGELDRRIADMESLTAQAEQIASRLTAARAMRTNRHAMVRIFDALANTVPDGVHYTFVSMTRDLFAASGEAASNDRVSSLMRNIENARWFSEPSLKRISETRDSPHYGGRASVFELTFRRAETGGDGRRPEPPVTDAARDDGGSAGSPRHA